MKISFWLTSTTRMMTKENWGYAPMGGAEISAVQLGEELLKLGHDVTYFLQMCQPFDRDNLHGRLHRQVTEVNHEYFICVRPHPVLTTELNPMIKKVLWSGDAFDQSSNDIFYDKKVANSINGFVFKSNWQKEKVLEKFFYIPPEKCNVITNGVKADYFKPNGVMYEPNRFIHTSIFYRGVVNFIDIWPMILSEMPKAEIHVFSKTSLYHGGLNDGKQDSWYQIAERLVHFPGIILREPVPQYILMHELKRANLMLYPNSGFVESSCGSAQQAVLMGTPVIATNRAGLPETIKEGGILIDQSEENWKEKFAEATLDLCRDTQRRQKIAEYGQKRLPLETWESRAIQWEEYLKSL